MLDNTLQCDPPAFISLQRAKGEARLRGMLRDGRTHISDLYQSGCAKLRFPKVYDHTGLEAVFINTAGGVTGGDRLDLAFATDPGGFLRVTGQACERAYRKRDGDARISTTLSVGAEGCLHWLPQETLIFEGSALSRKLNIDLASDASLVALEATIFGRAAMGETVRNGSYRESWRVRRDGKLVFADEAGAVGDLQAALSSRIVGRGATCSATLIAIGEKAESKTACEDLRENVSNREDVTWGCSKRMDVLVARAVADDSRGLRHWIGECYEFLSDGLALPRPWMC